MNVEHYVPLATRCTLGVGGSARFFVRAQDEKTLVEALEWADRGGVLVRVLGGGSNVVIADEGLDALVVRIGLRGRKVRDENDNDVELTVAAGEPWDDVVAYAVGRGWAGHRVLERDPPDLVGAAPIQNIGAYWPGRRGNDRARVRASRSHLRESDRHASARTIAASRIATARSRSIVTGSLRHPGRHVPIEEDHHAHGSLPGTR